jgi:diguanylate cyclase (GGDEF)-like protein
MKTVPALPDIVSGNRSQSPPVDTSLKTTTRKPKTKAEGLSDFRKKTRTRAAVIYGLTTIIPLLVMVYVIQSNVLSGKGMSVAWMSFLGLIAMTIGLLGGKLMKESWAKIGDALEAVDRLRKATGPQLGPAQHKTVDEIDRIPAVVNHLVEIARRQRDKLKDHSEQLHTLNTKVKESNEQLQEMCREDWLTGLYNRRHFGEVLEREIERAKRYERALALALIEPDTFHSLSDATGRQVTDELLIAIATIVRGAIRQIDLPFRYGSQRFAILFPETSAEKACVALDRIRASVEKHRSKGKTTQANGKVTLGIGVAMLSKDHHTPEEFVSSADEALYKAKSLGPDQLVACSPTQATLHASPIS